MGVSGTLKNDRYNDRGACLYALDKEKNVYSARMPVRVQTTESTLDTWQTTHCKTALHTVWFV
jgi:hypothetical protein